MTTDHLIACPDCNGAGYFYPRTHLDEFSHDGDGDRDEVKCRTCDIWGNVWCVGGKDDTCEEDGLIREGGRDE